MTELLSTPAMKEAVKAGKTEVEATIPKAPGSKLIDDLSDEFFERVKAGEPIDDIIENFHADFSDDVGEKVADDIVNALLNPNTNELPENSFKVLQRARQKLFDMKEEATGEHQRDLSRLYDDLTGEMVKLNDDFGKANATYAAELAKVDILRDNTLMAAVVDLKNGNFDLAVNKTMQMPIPVLEKFMKVLDDPEAFKNVAKSYLNNKLQTAKAGRDVASNLINAKEFKNIEVILGKQEAAALKAVVDAESKIAKTGKSVSGGSDTAYKAQAAQQVDEMTGQAKAPISAQNVAATAANPVSTMIAKGVDIVLNQFRPGVDKAFLNELAETLVISAPKGIAAMEKILKARQLTAAEIKALKPYLEDFLGAGRSARMAPVTSTSGQITANNQRKKKKK